MKKIIKWVLGAGVVIVAGLILIGILASSDTGLEVSAVQSSMNGPHNRLAVKNVGETPITIADVEINGRPECALGKTGPLGMFGTPEQATHDAFLNGVEPVTRGTFASWETNPNRPTLQVGDSRAFSSGCDIVRAKIKTNKGEAEFTFSSR